MKKLFIPVTLLILLYLSSCTKFFYACIRNTSNQVAAIDVYLLDKTDLKTLPNKVRMTNRIINLKSGYKKYLDSTQTVTWIDKDHFKLQIQPGTTVDLSDMAGIFINSHPTGDARVIITTTGKTDTLLNGRLDYRHEKFNYAGGFFSPKLYYDIKTQETPSITTTISPFTDLAAK